ncbi:hypothetical protein [Sandaracinus amylolyticus]|uniref:Lipoprotein n=1 Tax=Sandaracinus amylolyticus TaxID=927083 RepID=A0A0F6W4B7_9BACT|nr:hypothetical protein [Sandaracinus amylolyticus]AKF07150.1 hypothetical protein DB32_004299 [Sandaracinus amylolyticus]
MRVVFLVALASIAVACSGGGESGPSASVQADAAALQELLGSDPSRTVLREVEDAVDGERPVMAAEMIESAAAPAVRRQIERLQHASVSTQEGRRLRTRAVRVHRERLNALERYGQLLARGIGTEDTELLDAMHAYADAELAIVALHDDLAAIRPLAAGADDERDARLGGLPPLRRDEEPVDEGEASPTLPPEGPAPSAGEPAEPLPE